MHLEGVSHFSHVSEIVLVDTQPRSEFDGEHFDPIFTTIPLLKICYIAESNIC